MNYYVGKDADKIALRHYGVIGMLYTRDAGAKVKEKAKSYLND